MGVLVQSVVVGSVAGAMICLGLAAVAWHYREVPAALPFGILAATIAAWSFANAAFITSNGPTAAYIADRLVRAVSIQIPPLWFIFVMAYVGKEGWFSHGRIAVLWAYPIAYVIASVTAPLHGLASTPDEAVILTSGGATAPYVPTDVVYYPTVAFAFGLAGIGLVVLIRFLIRSRDVYRKQTAILAVGGASGIGTALVVELGLISHPGIDVTPLTMVIVGMSIGWALLRYDFLRLMPLAEDVLVDELPDPVFVVGANDRIIDYNPAAVEAFDDPDPTGQTLEDVVPGLASHLSDEQVFRHASGDGVTYYKPSVTLLRDQYETVRGRLTVLRNVTGQQRRQDRLEALQEATRRFLSASTDDQIAEIAVDYTERTLDCQAAGVFLGDDDGTLWPAAMTENATDLFEEDELVVGPEDGFAAYQAYESDEWVEIELEEDVGGPLEQLTFLPLGDHGILATGSTDSNGFDASDEGFATILTRTTQVALNRIERESELRRSRKALERRTEQIAFFNGVLRHSLRNALLVIEGRAEMLRESVSETEQGHVDTIVRWCSDLSTLNEEISSVNDTVTASEEQRLDRIDLTGLLDDRMEAYEERYPDTTFELDVDDGLSVQADELARSVVDSIVDNAVVHNDSETPRVEIRTVQAADRVQVHVADNGPGITDEMKAVVFERAVSTNQTASGFGLHFVSVLMNLYGGTLRFEDNDPEGTVAVLEFQQALDRMSDAGAIGTGGTSGDPFSGDPDGLAGATEIPDGEGIDPSAGVDGVVDEAGVEDGPGPDGDASDDPPEA